MILALEFSALVRSVAVLRPGAASTEPEVLAAVSDQGAKEVRPLVLVQRALDEAEVPRAAIERIVVGLGPGSYTGIRSAIALGQGWALATGVGLMGVSTVETLACQAQELGWIGHLSLVIDAQRREFYLASYTVTRERREPLQPLRLVTFEELNSRLQETASVPVGPEATRWFPQGRILIPAASVAGRLGATGGGPVEPEKLEPIYLREPGFVKAPPPRTVLP